MIPSPGTIYRAVQKLQPGEYVAFKNGAVKRRFYWQLPYHDDGTDSVDALERRFRLLLRNAARNAIDGPSAIGTFLSGGTDSSTVTALLAEQTGEPARTYSIGFAWEGFDEMKYARITARHLGAHAHEYYVTPRDIVEAIPIIARAYDEPFGNDSAAPTYFCAKMARASPTRPTSTGRLRPSWVGSRSIWMTLAGALMLAPKPTRKSSGVPTTMMQSVSRNAFSAAS